MNTVILVLYWEKWDNGHRYMTNFLLYLKKLKFSII